MKREETRLVKVGNLTIGHSNEVVIQSMSSFKTSKIKKVVKEINELTPLGLQLMRISIIDNNDIKAIKKIKSQINIPLVADIHYSLDYAFKAIKEGVDAIRINPGNTNPLKLKELLNLAIVKLKIEDDFISYSLNNFINLMYEYKIISDEIYNKYIFGSTDEREIQLYKNGMPSFIVAILNHDGQLNNIEIKDNGECSGNSDYQNYKNTKDDFVQYHLERYIK